DVVPFIRYRTGDYATYLGDRCSECGREHPLVGDILGHRIQETLVAADGSRITWTAINVHDDTYDNVRQLQFYQDAPGRALLRIAPGPEFSERDRARIHRQLALKLKKQLTFEIELVDEVSLTRSGKRIYVEQHIADISEPGLQQDMGTRSELKGSRA